MLIYSYVLGLYVMHTTGQHWVHRNLTKYNILLSSTGDVKIADLDYAKPVDVDGPPGVRTVRDFNYIRLIALYI
jgi:serine/threonine protein kinase